jgi:hypothetical protein
MSTKTVRLDEESERLLDELQRTTGESVSTVLKRGLVALREATREQVAREPYRVYEQLDLGPGGYALASARNAKQAMRSVLQQRRSRR